MILKKNQNIKLWLLMITAVVLWTIGTGFFYDLSATSEETYEGLKVFSDVIELIEKEYVDEVDATELIQNAIQGMVQSLDPHSSLLPREAFEDLQIDTKGKFTGIGIHITMQNGFVTVISPIEDTPAYKAGIKARDRIIKVDGKPTKDLRQAVNMMRGPKGTKVLVTIMREGVKEPIDFELIRDIIPIVSVKSIVLKPGYGYIRVSQFAGNTTTELEKALAEVESQESSLKGLILDLRDNGGGLLNQAIKVADLFLQDGLINSGSASASEIVAGALQDQKRALILGTTSFGKGSVQTVETLRDGSGLKLTIARYYTPSGQSIQAKGIQPDIVLKHRRMDLAELKEDEGLLKEKDLENHLEAEPGKSRDEEDRPDESSRMQDASLRVGPLKPEVLQTDNQIMHALEILTSYEIFKNLNS
jgi:carboxyl-terminal processing protease